MGNPEGTMRFYIICRGLYPGSKPWVLAETADEPYARDEANTWTTTFVVSRDDAFSNPHLRDAVMAWDARDDREYQRDMVREDAEAEMDATGPDVETDDGWALDPARALTEALTGRMLTFMQFRALPRNAPLSDGAARDAYLEYLRLEAAWSDPVDEPSDR